MSSFDPISRVVKSLQWLFLFVTVVKGGDSFKVLLKLQIHVLKYFKRSVYGTKFRQRQNMCLDIFFLPKRLQMQSCVHSANI